MDWNQWASGPEEGTCQPGWLTSQAGVLTHTLITPCILTDTLHDKEGGGRDLLHLNSLQTFRGGGQSEDHSLHPPSGGREGKTIRLDRSQSRKARALNQINYDRILMTASRKDGSIEILARKHEPNFMIHLPNPEMGIGGLLG